MWLRDDFAPPFRDIKGCVSLSFRKASRFLVFVFVVSFISLIEPVELISCFCAMLGRRFWNRRRLPSAGRIRVCDTLRWTRPRA